MKWYGRLYYGKTAAHSRFRIRSDIRKGKVRPATYVVLLRDEDGAPLEMYHNLMLYTEPLKSCEYTIIGLAEGRAEGNEIIRRIAEGAYKYNRCSDFRAYLMR